MHYHFLTKAYSLDQVCIKLNISKNAIIFIFVIILITVTSIFLIKYKNNKNKLDRQLIDAIVNQDEERALILVNQGADPNTTFKPLPKPSFIDFWNHFFHWGTTTSEYSPTALQLACGATWSTEKIASGTKRFRTPWYERDSPDLVDAMLRHGGNARVRDADGLTLISIASSYRVRFRTVQVLIQHGADVNSQGNLPGRIGETPLQSVIVFSHIEMPRDSQLVRETIKQLIAHGANPNLPDKHGHTAIQVAEACHRPDYLILMQHPGK